jgi:hypothetical protein
MPLKIETIDALLKELFDQVPTMVVRSVTLTPAEPAEGEGVIARVDVADSREVLCEINADGSLQSATVIEI